MKDPFNESLGKRVIKSLKADTTTGAANALFGQTVDRHSETFEDLKKDLRKADMDVLYRTYVAKMFLYGLLAFILVFFTGLYYVSIQGMGPLKAARYLLGAPVISVLAVIGFMYVYPDQRAGRRRKSIEENIPFAMNHLSAIATSGIPPSAMFELLASFEEYGEISREAGKISRRVNAFGEDFTTALREVAQRSPSEEWSDILYGILSTVETGGNLEDFLKEKSEEALFEFKIEKEKEIERLSTYASFYTAILIAAPVFLVTVLSVINLLSPNLAGFSIRSLMWMGVHVLIPAINILFILFLGIKVN